MRRVLVRGLIALSMAGLGWAAARAQRPEPDFELVVDAPAGAVTIECRRGCELLFGRSAQNMQAMPQTTFSFSCSGTPRCSSGTVAGWLRR